MAIDHFHRLDFHLFQKTYCIKIKIKVFLKIRMMGKIQKLINLRKKIKPFNRSLRNCKISWILIIFNNNMMKILKKLETQFSKEFHKKIWIEKIRWNLCIHHQKIKIIYIKIVKNNKEEKVLITCQKQKLHRPEPIWKNLVTKLHLKSKRDSRWKANSNHLLINKIETFCF
jgi:hypothetical protein